MFCTVAATATAHFQVPKANLAPSGHNTSSFSSVATALGCNSTVPAREKPRPGASYPFGLYLRQNLPQLPNPTAPSKAFRDPTCHASFRNTQRASPCPIPVPAAKPNAQREAPGSSRTPLQHLAYATLATLVLTTNFGNVIIPQTTWSTVSSSQPPQTVSTTLAHAAIPVTTHLPAARTRTTATTKTTPYPSHLTPLTSLPMKHANILNPILNLILPPLPRQKPLACNHINSIYFNKYRYCIPVL
ncbi:hypothetical protein KM472_gp003 [Cynomolgus macaque cytomegalovirus strain Ottawa]|uniref:Uncharacterized protein n=1 Tax=macacine betaherpesvirus 8 TaxID=2560567 RepID=G8H106_9BETA|nr:hypothetical protein KM472_gp003 [Cynomolgus macaque cytomegalovirus strain Ottawa]AEQ32080.1 hypothetical protein cy03 [Cynomolgus macaque cytomegalovirus strain Ottawa]